MRTVRQECEVDRAGGDGGGTRIYDADEGRKTGVLCGCGPVLGCDFDFDSAAVVMDIVTENDDADSVRSPDGERFENGRCDQDSVWLGMRQRNPTDGSTHLGRIHRGSDYWERGHQG